MNRETSIPDAIESIVSRIEGLAFGCVDVGAALRRIGDVSAANYVDGAGISLRIAGQAHRAHEPTNTLGGADLAAALTGRAAPDCAAHIAITPARRTGPDLGVCLAGSAAAREAFADPLGAALLEDALWRWVWIHQDARTEWQTTREGARAIVAIMTNGQPPVGIGDGMAGRIDGQVARVLGGIGWTLVPDQVPDDSTS
ncbi:MAG: hypothetical protein V4472_17565 [Pseudomonadota bacterium]